ncbi:platelet-derived growth factor C-like isoform X2 [Paramormyrops kingsleyae]|uniref:platelet-derived growth factor C-like isoform X2 n=1 Tax=Paramormyrops kingsleyae TaxID=1676925 RepID=UPI000CD5FA11|nr:platelet-derived growth factor C-like isoform X2 [Paramormyrops kingsleyae]
MILLLLFLLVSSAQRHGSGAESSVGNTFQHSGLKGLSGVQNERIIRVSAEGTVSSPDFPQTYPRNRILVWRLVAASENMRIQLVFDERFGLEETEDGICKYDFVEIEDPVEGTILGRWCGSQAAPGKLVSKGNQFRIQFQSDQYLPSKPGFCIRYSPVPVKVPEPAAPAVSAPSLQSLEVLTEAVSGLSTVEEVMKYLEPDQWQLHMEDLYKPAWPVLGKSFFHHRKARGAVDLNVLKEEVRLYSCTPRNFSVSLREELRRTDTIFWPSCLLVKRCGGNCACCSYGCRDCQCVPTRVTKKYHEVLQLRHRGGGKGFQKSLTDVHLEHHEECTCICKEEPNG